MAILAHQTPKNASGHRIGQVPGHGHRPASRERCEVDFGGIPFNHAKALDLAQLVPEHAQHVAVHVHCRDIGARAQERCGERAQSRSQLHHGLLASIARASTMRSTTLRAVRKFWENPRFGMSP